MRLAKSLVHSNTVIVGIVYIVIRLISELFKFLFLISENDTQQQEILGWLKYDLFYEIYYHQITTTFHGDLCS